MKLVKSQTAESNREIRNAGMGTAHSLNGADKRARACLRSDEAQKNL